MIYLHDNLKLRNMVLQYKKRVWKKCITGQIIDMEDTSKIAFRYKYSKGITYKQHEGYRNGYMVSKYTVLQEYCDTTIAT